VASAFLARPRQGISSAARGSRSGGSIPCGSACSTPGGFDARAAPALVLARRSLWRWSSFVRSLARLPPEPQDLIKEAFPGVEVAAAEFIDAVVVGLLIALEHAEGKILGTGPLDLVPPARSI